MDATPAPTDGTKPVLVRVLRIVAWLAAIALVLFVLDQLGVPVSDWIRDFFDQLARGSRLRDRRGNRAQHRADRVRRGGLVDDPSRRVPRHASPVPSGPGLVRGRGGAQ